jgi:hypothetical protein
LVIDKNLESSKSYDKNYFSVYKQNYDRRSLSEYEAIQDETSQTSHRNLASASITQATSGTVINNGNITVTVTDTAGLLYFVEIKNKCTRTNGNYA